MEGAVIGESAFSFERQVFKEALSQGVGGEPGNEGSKHCDKRKLEEPDKLCATGRRCGRGALS